MRKAGWVALVFVVAIGALVVAGVLSKHSSGAARAAPALPAAVLSGRRVTVASLRGHPALINFWASWCEPCRKEAPELERYHQRHRGDAALVGVDFTDNPSSAREFVARYRWTFSSLSDPAGDTGRSYGVSGIPVTYALDARGRVVQTLRGPQTLATLTAAARSAAR